MLLDLPITVLEGHLPAPGSLTEVAVTPALLSKYGIGRTHVASALGAVVELGAPRGFLDPDGFTAFRSRWTRATIVGVVAQEAGSGGVLASLPQATASHTWTVPGIPLLTATPRDPPMPASSYWPQGWARSHRFDPKSPGWAIRPSAPENIITTVERYVHVVEIVLGGVGVIARWPLPRWASRMRFWLPSGNGGGRLGS